VKILFVSQYYPPESNAPANRVSTLARLWAKTGDEVTVLTGFPHHPEGKVHPGYCASRPLVERDQGVRIVRVPIYASPNKGFFRRSATYATFSISAALAGMPLAGRPDVVVATSPQILAAVAGAWHSIFRRVPLVLEIRDLWPESIVAVGVLSARNPIIRALTLVEEGLYALATRIVVVTESFRVALEGRGIDPARVRVIPNGVDMELFKPEEVVDEAFEFAGRFVIVYAGTVGMAHDLGTMLEAAALLKTDPRFLFVVAGEGAKREELEARAAREGLDNVRFLGRLARERIPALLNRADLSLIMLRKSPLFHMVLPCKVFESMGCATPILLGVNGEARRLVERAGAGRFFQPGDPADLAQSVRELAADPIALSRMGDSGRRFVREHYRFEDLAAGYRALLDSVVSR
jgi:putative colanic acid biosynthesis glycosyltransferase WcaI